MKKKKNQKKSRIKDNPSSKQLLDSIEGVHQMMNNPLMKIVFPNLNFDQHKDEIERFHKEAHELTSLPDKFNDTFADTGWFITASMNIDLIKNSLILAHSKSIDEAENILADSVNKEYLDLLFLKIQWREVFDKRLRLFKLIKDDYLEERYHACIPLLLSIIDGLVDELTRHVGIFSENIDMTAFDSLAGHETGLQSMAKILRSTRKKVNVEPITIPYRNGILHGKELAFDNKIVAAKCWHLLSAIVDWHNDIKNPKKRKEEKSLHEVLAEHQEHKKKMDDFEQRFEEYAPRDFNNIYDFPILDIQVETVLDNTPEKTVIIFLDHLKNHRFGLITPLLFQFEEQRMKQQTSKIAKDFKNIQINSYKIIIIEDTAPAMSKVVFDIVLSYSGQENIAKQITVYLSYLDCNGEALVRNTPNGSWIIHPSVFMHLL